MYIYTAYHKLYVTSTLNAADIGWKLQNHIKAFSLKKRGFCLYPLNPPVLPLSPSLLPYPPLIQMCLSLHPPPPVRARGVKSRMCPPYPQRDRKRRLIGAVCRNHRIKRVVPCRCLDGHVKEPYEMSMAWEPDRRSNFFFSPPAHLCAVTYMTEISLIVTLNN